MDSWELKNADEIFTGVEDLVDEENGESKLNTVESEKYSRDVISSDGRNKKMYWQEELKELVLLTK